VHRKHERAHYQAYDPAKYTDETDETDETDDF